MSTTHDRPYAAGRGPGNRRTIEGSSVHRVSQMHELVRIGGGRHTHAWVDDHPACKPNGYSTLKEPRVPSKVVAAGAGAPSCPGCLRAMARTAP